jgi:hypothetical protein
VYFLRRRRMPLLPLPMGMSPLTNSQKQSTSQPQHTSSATLGPAPVVAPSCTSIWGHELLLLEDEKGDRWRIWLGIAHSHGCGSGQPCRVGERCESHSGEVEWRQWQQSWKATAAADLGGRAGIWWPRDFRVWTREQRVVFGPKSFSANGPFSFSVSRERALFGF